MHLRVTRAILVLGRAGRGNERGIDGGARFEQQAPGRKQGVDGGHDLQGQVIDFEQAARPQDGALVGQPAHAGVEPRKLAVQRRVVQSLLHGGVRQGEPLLLKWMRSSVSTLKGVLPVLPAGACGCGLAQPVQPTAPRRYLTEKHALAHCLAGYLEPASTKADLLHLRFNDQLVRAVDLCRVSLAKNPNPSVLKVNKNTKSGTVLHKDNIPANEANDYLLRITKSTKSVTAVKN